MKRCRTGILGVKKDPKNQILFSFSAREGEEWPSDDSDSDFVPSDEDDTNVKRKKKKQAKSSVKSRTESTVKPNNVLEKDVVCASLPEEIWLYIFGFVVKETGPLPFLCRAAKVCQLWRNIASHPSLWRKFDLSFGWIRVKRDTLRWLVTERLTQCAEINLTNRPITNDQLKISVSTLKDITLKHGLTRLMELHLGGNFYQNFPALANSIFENCPQLEVFDASNCRFSGDYVSVDVQKFQTGCPKLRVLRMGSSKFRLKKTNGPLPGFEDLRELSLGCLDLSKSCGISTAFVHDILVKSSKLKLLDLGGCLNMEDMTPLLGLPFTELEQLYLSNSLIRLNYLLGPLLQKCSHSLRILHIDKNIFKEDSLDSALQELFPQFGSSPLEMINAAETNISQSSVESILRHCGKLHSINLSSCRALPRGIKREYKKDEIKQLKSFCGIK